MRKMSAWVISFGLLVALALICASAKRCIGLSLPVAVLLGLGTNACILLWEHREKMEQILSSGSQES
ncbi:MAG: hypothetical protein J7M05_00265 [Anaerolineae bacterium]|nr:hypothetical protein [Anaerolineae bacterium]